MIEYPIYNKLPKEYIQKKLKEFFDEDIPNLDITTTLTISKDEKSKAVLEAEDELVFAGVEIIKAIFGNDNDNDDEFELEIHVNDGDKLKFGDKIATIIGSSQKILEKERVLLNLIQRLSGIATLTNQYVEIAKPHNVKILDTRKTIPGLRLFDKYAVAIGGGHNHRLDLSSGILIKDNHIKAAGGIKNAIDKIRNSELWRKNPLKIELEVDTLEQITEGLEAKADGYLLDNMNRETTFEAVKMIRSYENGNNIFIESSGGINLTNLHNYVDTGINAISIGALTHSAKGANIHLEFFDL